MSCTRRAVAAGFPLGDEVTALLGPDKPRLSMVPGAGLGVGLTRPLQHVAARTHEPTARLGGGGAGVTEAAARRQVAGPPRSSSLSVGLASWVLDRSTGVDLFPFLTVHAVAPTPWWLFARVPWKSCRGFGARPAVVRGSRVGKGTCPGDPGVPALGVHWPSNSSAGEMQAT